MKFQGLVGPSYNLPSANVDCQRTVNLYPVLVESGTGKEGQQYYLKSTPGLKKQFTVGTGPIRMILPDEPVNRGEEPSNRIFVVSGNKMYKCTYNSGTDTWTTAIINSFDDPTIPMSMVTTSGPVRGQIYERNAVGNVIIRGVFVDGTKAYLYYKRHDPGDPVQESFWIDTGFIAAPNPTNVLQIDSHYVYPEGESNKFWVSEYGTIGVTALDFASAEGDPDKIVAALSKDRELWLFNQKSTEVWNDTGNAAFPFERTAFIEKGCVAPNSVAKIESIAFWLGRDEFGEGIVYEARGLSPERISTHAVEAAIRGYADMSAATAYTYQEDGHPFYVLNFAEGTWVYDLSTKAWHERAYTNTDGDLERHRADCHAFFPDFSMHLVGDYENGNVYTFEEKVYTDDTAPITRMRITPHVSNSKKSLTCHSLEIDMETGIGLVSGQGADPQVMLSWSDDGGHTFKGETWTSAGGKVGGIGDFKKRVRWRRLGSFIDRVFKIVITDPVPVTIMNAEIEMEAGNS